MPDFPDPTVATGSDGGGDDDDSLFGSPPSSPARGRSPSPLALPGGPGSAQNVGALALPGSHLVAELPTNPPASLPLSASASGPSQPSVQRAQSVAATSSDARVQTQPRASSSRRSTPGPSRQTRTDPSVRKTRKGKEKEKPSTPRPTPPPIPLPSPDEPPPPNFLRNQQALLGLAGMVGGVNPANLSKARHTRGATAENPIVVEDEPQPQQPSIGKRPTHPSPADQSQLPQPSSEQILRTLLQQKNIFPVVVSLLRLLAPGAPSLASVPPGYPHYPYHYPPQPPASNPWSRAQTPSQSSASDSRPSSSSGAPPHKRRKLNAVPAGAGDWDVPYPFPEGQGPENYRLAWEQQRGKQLLKDLVQLVQNAARKAATKAWYQQHVQPRYPVHPALKYYRPATLYYGLERGQSAPPPSSQMQHRAVGSRQCPTPGSSTPRVAADVGSGLPHAPAASGPAPSQLPSAIDGTVHPPNAFDQLVQSLLAAQHQQQQQQQHQREHERHAPASVSSGHQASRVPVDPSASSATAAPMPELSATDESTQAFLDNWLEMLTTFPPGDPNDASIGTGSATTAAATSSSTSTSPDIGPQSAQDSSSPKMAKSSGGAPQISDDLIDPALLGMHVDIPTDSAVAEASASRSTGEQSHAVPAPPVALDVRTAAAAPSGDNATSSTTVQPATPSLVDSPSVTVSSLADPAERDAEGGGDGGTAMPLWDWAFQDVQETTAEGMKMLEELAGMDVDVDLDAVMGVEMDMGGWEEVLGTSTALEESGQTSAQPSEGTQPRPKAQGNATRDEANGTTSAQTSTEPHQPPADASLLQSQPENEAGPPAIIPPAAFEAQTPFSNSSPVESQGVSAVPTEPPPPPSLLPPQASCFPLPPPPVTPPQITSAPPARAKGKAKAIPGSGPATLGLGLGRGRGKQDKRAIVERARAMREALEKEVERAKVALWETTLEQGVLVGLGRELDKGG